MKKLLLFAVAILCAHLGATAQLVSGNAFLQGQYVELGMNQCGGWGSTVDAPAGYHARSGNATFPLNLGFVADPDKDGWTVGSPNKYNGDYFMPSPPTGGWSLSVNGTTYNSERYTTNSTTCGSISGTALPGAVTSVQSTGARRTATWVGSGSGVTLTKTAVLSVNKLYFTVTVALKNTTGASIPDVYYADYIDPNNDYYYQDSFNAAGFVTQNNIVFQNPTDGKSLVRALGAITQSYLGLGSKDCRSKVFRGTNTFIPYTGSAESLYKGTTNNTLSGSPSSYNDYYIGVGFDIGTLAAGDSTSFAYTVILKATDFDEALASTDPGFTANGISYNSGDTAIACASNPLNIRLTNASYYTWNWSPATGLNTTTGPNVTATVTGVTRYIATGTSVCGTTVKDTVYVLPVNRLYVDSSKALSGNGYSWATAMKTVNQALDFANSNTCVAEIWVRKGTYYPTAGTSRDSSFRILRNGIKLYGGFAGTETLLSQRNITANVTTLSGDIGVANDSTDNSYHVVTILTPTGTVLTPTGTVMDTTTLMDGCIVERGVANGSGSQTINGQTFFRSDCGGVYFGSDGAATVNSVRIINCVIRRNYGSTGGGLYFRAVNSVGSSPSFINCQILNNRSGSIGGGLVLVMNFTNPASTTVTFNDCKLDGNIAVNSHGGAIHSYNGALVLKRTTFSSNKSLNGLGGSICNFNASMSIDSCAFTGSSCFLDGGAIYTNVDKPVLISNSQFLNNTGGSYGGGITQVNGQMSLRACVFSGNVSTIGGGGVHSNNGSSDTVTNCLFVGNTSGLGGGLQHAANAQPLIMVNTTFYNNTATTSGGAINWQSNSGTGTIGNVILWGNNGPSPAISVTGTAALAVTYSNVQGGFAGTGNINLNPQFINPANGIGADGIWGTNDDGLRLTPCSPSINTGSNALVPAGITTDITGAVRTQNTNVDMGAYEMPYNSTGLSSTTIAMSPANPVCSNTTSVLFTATTVAPGAGPTYQWYKNGAAVGSNQNTYTANSWSNNDSVWVIHTNNDCILKDTSNKIFIQVAPVPAAPGTITGPASPCAATSQTYAIAAVANATTYTWAVPAGWSITAGQGTASVTVTPSATAGNVTVTAGNVCGTSAAATLAVTPNVIPAQPGAITGNTAPCPGTTNNTYSITAVAGASTYTWAVPAGWTITAGQGTTSITVTATSATGNITVTAGNVCGNSTAQSLAISPFTVTPAPATPTGPAAPCASTTGNVYSTTAVAGATTYTWTVPTGWTITAGQGTNAITVTAPAGSSSGNITVTSGNVCQTSPAATLAVSTTVIPAQPGTITGNAAPCIGVSNVYSITAVTGATTYTWVVPTGWTITAGQGTNAITVTTTSTTGSVSITAGNTCGTSVARTLAVTPLASPVAPAAPTGPAAPCASTTGNVYSTTAVTGATTYTWAVPAGWVITAGQGTISITATPSATAGNVTVTADNVCGNSTAQSLSVVPLSIPATPGAISGNPAPCIGATQTYSVAAVTNATSYSWTAPAGWTLSSGGTSTSVTYIVTNATSGQVQVKANGSCGSSANNALNVAPTPVLTPAVTVSTNTPNVCQGTNVAFTATPVNGGTNPTYQWKKNGSNVGGPTDLYNDPLLTSNDVITVVMTSSLPCVTSASVTASNSASVNVTPTAVPGININTAPSVTLCEGTPVTFVTNISGGGTSPVYQWYRNGIAILGQTGPNYTGSGFSDGDTLTVLLTSNAPCRATNTVLSNKVGLIVQQKVVPTLSVSANPGTIVPPGTLVTLTANVTTAAGATPFYQWYQNGVAIGGATGSTYTTQVQSNGDVFSVQVYGLGLCATPSNLRSALLELNTTTVGIGGAGAVVSAESMVLELFPNPNSGRFTVRADWGTSVSAGERVELELVNALGQVVYRQELGMLGGKWRTDIALEDNVANGLYLLRIKQQRAGGSIAKPVMIQR